MRRRRQREVSGGYAEGSGSFLISDFAGTIRNPEQIHTLVLDSEYGCVNGLLPIWWKFNRCMDSHANGVASRHPFSVNAPKLEEEVLGSGVVSIAARC